MKIEKLIFGILILSLVTCKNSEHKAQDKTKPPEAEFDFSSMPENSELKPYIYVKDLEKLFTKEENDYLEKYLIHLNNESGIKILILTAPSKEKLEKDWNIENGYTNSGIIITVSMSLKEVGIGIAEDTDKKLSKTTREKIINNTLIPEFENENYYGGIKKGIEEILNNWE